jgi:hypothetical protein
MLIINFSTHGLCLNRYSQNFRTIFARHIEDLCYPWQNFMGLDEIY